MSPTLTLLLAASIGWSSPEVERELQFVVAAAFIQISESRLGTEPVPAAITVCDVPYYYDDFAAVLTRVVAVDVRSLLTYGTDLPIFRDKL